MARTALTTGKDVALAIGIAGAALAALLTAQGVAGTVTDSGTVEAKSVNISDDLWIEVVEDMWGDEVPEAKR